MYEHKEKSAVSTAMPAAEKVSINNSNIAQSENDCKILFGARLKKLREKQGLTRKNVADYLGITRASLEYYEKGKRTPNISTIAKIVKYFNTTTDYLFGLSDVSTTDVDIKQVCDYTGLSEEVVEALHRNATVEQIHLTLPVSEKISINQLINNLFKE